jgi:hypothetical protein
LIGSVNTSAFVDTNPIRRADNFRLARKPRRTTTWSLDLLEAYAAESCKIACLIVVFPSHLVTRPGFPSWISGMSRPRLAAETGGRNGELALERPVKSGFGLIADFGCDLVPPNNWSKQASALPTEVANA